MSPRAFVRSDEPSVNPRELRMPARALGFAILVFLALAVAVAIRVMW